MKHQHHRLPTHHSYVPDVSSSHNPSLYDDHHRELTRLVRMGLIESILILTHRLESVRIPGLHRFPPRWETLRIAIREKEEFVTILATVEDHLPSIGKLLTGLNRCISAVSESDSLTSVGGIGNITSEKFDRIVGEATDVARECISTRRHTRSDVEEMMPALFRLSLPLAIQLRKYHDIPSTDEVIQEGIESIYHLSDYQTLLNVIGELFRIGLDPVSMKRLPGEPSLLESARTQVQQAESDWMSALERIFQPKANGDEIESAMGAHVMSLIKLAETEKREKRMKEAILEAWKGHSMILRKILFAAAPGQLIPPLLDIVAKYLDLD